MSLGHQEPFWLSRDILHLIFAPLNKGYQTTKQVIFPFVFLMINYDIIYSQMSSIQT